MIQWYENKKHAISTRLVIGLNEVYNSPNDQYRSESEDMLLTRVSLSMHNQKEEEREKGGAKMDTVGEKVVHEIYLLGCFKSCE